MAPGSSEETESEHRAGASQANTGISRLETALRELREGEGVHEGRLQELLEPPKEAVGAGAQGNTDGTEGSDFIEVATEVMDALAREPAGTLSRALERNRGLRIPLGALGAPADGHTWKDGRTDRAFARLSRSLAQKGVPPVAEGLAREAAEQLARAEGRPARVQAAEAARYAAEERAEGAVDAADPLGRALRLPEAQARWAGMRGAFGLAARCGRADLRAFSWPLLQEVRGRLPGSEPEVFREGARAVGLLGEAQERGPGEAARTAEELLEEVERRPVSEWGPALEAIQRLAGRAGLRSLLFAGRAFDVCAKAQGGENGVLALRATAEMARCCWPRMAHDGPALVELLAQSIPELPGEEERRVLSELLDVLEAVAGRQALAEARGYDRLASLSLPESG